MNKTGRAALLAAIILAEASVASAQSGAAGSAADADRLICRRTAETGSLVRARRQCFTRAQWDRIAETARRGAERTVQELAGGDNTNH